MESEALTVLPHEAGLRLDRFLAGRYTDTLSRNYFQSLIQNEEAVAVNGKPIKKGRRLDAGDLVEFTLLPLPELELKAENLPLDILYEDSHLLLINKPAGMLVHPAPGFFSGTVVNALLYHYQDLFESSPSGTPWETFRPGIVHRLDKETSGVLLIAKNGSTHSKLTKLFAERCVNKEYLAICHGNPGQGTISAPIGRHPKRRQEMAVITDGKEALTEYATLSSKSEFSLVSAKPKTGRTHQIRVHLKFKGAAILGDSVYGNSALNSRYTVKRQLLHAYQLTFTHPHTEQVISVKAPLPADFLEWKNRICS